MESKKIYRHYNDNGDLLYLGISVNPIARLAAHKLSSEWFDQISKVTIESRKFNHFEALDYEREAIEKEKPLFNKVHSGDTSYMRHKPDRALHISYQRPCLFGKMYDSVKDASEKIGCSSLTVKIICQGVMRRNFTVLPTPDCYMVPHYKCVAPASMIIEGRLYAKPKKCDYHYNLTMRTIDKALNSARKLNR